MSKPGGGGKGGGSKDESQFLHATGQPSGSCKSNGPPTSSDEVVHTRLP
jgi:hypothetical protein